MKRKQWLLAFLGVEPRGGWRWLNGAEYWFDPIRVMKGLFLAQKENAAGEPGHPLSTEPYRFYAYAYGPFTSELYGDLDELFEAGLVERQKVPGKTYVRWRLTDMGWAASKEAQAELAENRPKRLERLRRAKGKVVFSTFAALLRYVYDRYPEYAKESVVNLG